jgi:nitroimidazol reductase NimA-like FMN-containing flavoprotein (pyridoxamine 5'-phosphate oxidase superfamily)
LKKVVAEMSAEEMTQKEIDHFLTCARVGRLGICLENGPYIVPVGYAYSKGKIFFHTCNKGLKIEGIKKNPNVCFEVDETLSDASMFKSVIIFGTAEIIDDKEEMIPHLQKLIDKYRVPESFNEYMSKPGRNREKELEAVRICLITPKKITSRKYVKKW